MKNAKQNSNQLSVFDNDIQEEWMKMKSANEAKEYSQRPEFRNELRSILIKYFSEYSDCIIYSKFMRPSFYNYEEEKPCYIMELSTPDNMPSSFTITEREDKELMVMRFLYSRFNLETDIRITKTKIYVIWEMKIDE